MGELGLNTASVLALAVAGGAMFVALWRARRSPRFESREQELERRLRELESTVATLQRLLLEKQQEIDRLTERMRQLERFAPVAPAAQAPTGPRAHPEEFLVVLGDDPALERDAAVLRAKEITEKLRPVVMRKARKDRLAGTLQRYRSRGTPIKRVHFATHGNEQGILLGEEIADGVWLSENLAGTDLIVITGCSTSMAAHLARVAPTVVSMTWEIGMQDAMEFSGVFWAQIAAGETAEDAFYEAVRRAPAAGEVAELHG